MSTSWAGSGWRTSSPLSPMVNDCNMSTVDTILASTELIDLSSVDTHAVALESILCLVSLVVARTAWGM
jgi:hypothetical protein